ncbi:uncharacterized protein JN550_012954 [Neoarthrinium moseri]|uniref:uncharacterized protein n=1 Tax=Neoarthrinium moseri TaxID=1658444 RepID=UPI001FDBCFC9|nr:uncharacterized protein JN550_012954 [Neoarthrinium moseri]KAI1857879.1 hypothetical protein JN550_012954 [Neoarthrinium moseri]
MALSVAPSLPSLYGLSAVSGISFHHLYARRVEIDFIVWHLLGVGVAIYCALCAWFTVIWGFTLGTALKELSICLLVFALSLTSSILIYRGFFHRLRNFPGPYGARFSSLWLLRKSSGDFKTHRNLERIHNEYGDIVRIGPRLLSIKRPDALPELMALGKGVWWAHAGSDSKKISFSLSRVPEDHKQRRRPWELAFSTPVMERFDAGIQELIGIYIEKTKQQGTIDVPDMLGKLSFDVMGLVGYGHSFGNTSSGVAHPGLVAMRKAHYAFGTLRWTAWLMQMLESLPGGGSDFVPFLNLCAGVVRERQKQHKSQKLSGEQDNNKRKDVMAHLLEAMDEGGPSAPPTEEALAGESRVMIAAGADTTQSALANVVWFMAADQKTLKHLQKLLDDIFPGGDDTFSYAKLIGNSEALAWTDAILNETLRVRPPGISGNPRTVGPEGMIIPASEYGPEICIPGGVDVLSPTWVIHRDEKSFERPTEFLPERWIEGSQIRCNKSAHFPFSIGKHVCVGKPLALREVRSVIARTALNFDIEFPPNEDWQAYEETIMDAFTMTLPPFKLIFKERTVKNNRD